MDVWDSRFRLAFDLDGGFLMDGALERRPNEWEQPQSVFWALRTADDAEWMFGIPAFVSLSILTEASSWMTNQ
jgi:hypothetical protein